jgi:sphingolipid delta-4 desaturase
LSPNLVPGAIGFGICHLKHHTHQGDYESDADIPNEWEARLIGNKWYGNSFWMRLFPIFQLARPPGLKAITVWNAWTVVNFLDAAAFDLTVFYFCGWAGLWYLGSSFFFSIGLHPLGARWVQEHYTLDPDQETFSYYGPINRVALNVGYHNEHHDFPSIA